MQTLKMIIHGSYYDSQIYKGRLYLWSTKGSILTISWDHLIESVGVEERLKLALRCAFLQSEYLYGHDFRLFFQDREIKTLLERKFLDLSELQIEFSESDLRGRHFIIAEQDNPFPFPHADSLFYADKLYVGSPSGISASEIKKRNKKPITKAQKLWDGPVLTVNASYSTLALSAGSEGVFQRPSNLDIIPHKEEYPIIREHSNSAKWMYYSIYSSSYYNSGYLADFDNKEIKDSGVDNLSEEEYRALYDRDPSSPKPRQRELRGILSSDSIFRDEAAKETTKYSWGLHDKICLAMQNHIDIVQYSPHKDQYYQRFVPLGRIETDFLPGDIIRGDSALFGYIIELEDGLLVIDSEVERHWLPGEPVNWRVFPKSIFYTNQMHVIYDDFICIHSFNQDYFVNQDAKSVGIRHSRVFPQRSR